MSGQTRLLTRAKERARKIKLKRERELRLRKIRENCRPIPRVERIAFAEKKTNTKTKFNRLQDFPSSLSGYPTNRFGGNNLQRMEGLRGASFGPASEVVVVFKKEIDGKS